jgi:hypothetical protein
MIKHKIDETKEYYIGSSYDLKDRCRKHKTSCNNQNSKQSNIKLYKYIRENGGWDCWNMILLYDYPCKNRNELELEEKKCIKEYKSTLNQVIPRRTKKEYYVDNKEKISQYDKERYEANKEKILEQKKEYHKANKEKILQQNKKYRQNNKEKIAQYKKELYEANKEKNLQYQKERYDANKEKILQQNKEYRQNNKEKIKQQKKEYHKANKEKIKQHQKYHYEANKEEINKKQAIKINCDICNLLVRNSDIARHKRSQKCKNSHK